MADTVAEKTPELIAAEKKAADAERRAADADAKLKAADEAEAKKAAKSKADADADGAKAVKAAEERAKAAEAALEKLNKRASDAAGKIFEGLSKASQTKLEMVKDKLSPTEWHDLVAAERDGVTADAKPDVDADKSKDKKPPPVGGSGGVKEKTEGYQLSQRALDVLDADGVNVKPMAHAQLKFGTDADADDVEEGRAAEGIPRFSLPVRKLREMMNVQSPKVLSSDEYNRRMQQR